VARGSWLRHAWNASLLTWQGPNGRRGLVPDPVLASPTFPTACGVQRAGFRPSAATRDALQSYHR
jgi:hypothetical protein